MRPVWWPPPAPRLLNHRPRACIFFPGEIIEFRHAVNGNSNNRISMQSSKYRANRASDVRVAVIHRYVLHRWFYVNCLRCGIVSAHETVQFKASLEWAGARLVTRVSIKICSFDWKYVDPAFGIKAFKPIRLTRSSKISYSHSKFCIREVFCFCRGKNYPERYEPL